MIARFLCPHCRAVLNPADAIILAVEKDEKRGLILLSPRPADYRYVCDASFCDQIQIGDIVDFSCPACATDLTSPLSDKLVEILIMTPEKELKVAQFSRICGEQATFVHDGTEVLAYGKDHTLFEDLNFGEHDRWW